MSHTKASSIHNASIPRSTFYDSPFGRMFGKLEPWRTTEVTDSAAVQALQDFATASMSEVKNEPEPDNTNIPAGYTYFGQFVDHDITFDPTSSLQRQNDPNKLKNFRTPRLDLDCIYGSGPADQPYMYSDSQKGMLLTGVVGNSLEPDLPRNVEGRAIIGDMRNDENLIVSQFQLGMIKLHNRVYTSLLGHEDPNNLPESFELDVGAFQEAQRIVRWFYQYIVWNDFVKRLVKDSLWKRVLSKKNGVFHYGGQFYRWKVSPYIPVEFSVAAYRFGHSLIRPGYQINLNNDVGLGFGVEKPIFNPDGSKQNDLRGFRPIQARHSIQWDWFFTFPSSGGPFPQPSRKIDPKLSSAVFALDEGPEPRPNRLAFLNLLRSMRMELPTGTAVANAMGFKPIAVGDHHEDILWHYILNEASLMVGANKGKMLGNVGGTIVAEVFAGLLKGDPLSYVNLFPAWTPAQESALPFDAPVNGSDWEVADLLRAAGMPVTADDVENFIESGHV